MTSPFHVPIAEQIWDAKYRFKEADGTPIDQTVEDTWRRIAEALTAKETSNMAPITGTPYAAGGRVFAAAIRAIAPADVLAGLSTNTEAVARLVEAAQALGAVPGGYCFCSVNRVDDDSKIHEPECEALRAALAAMETNHD